MTDVCFECGAPLPPQPRYGPGPLYCSHKCHSALRPKSTNCDSCGAELPPWKWNYCSQQCCDRQKWRRRMGCPQCREKVREKELRRQRRRHEESVRRWEENRPAREATRAEFEKAREA